MLAQLHGHGGGVAAELGEQAAGRGGQREGKEPEAEHGRAAVGDAPRRVLDLVGRGERPPGHGHQLGTGGGERDPRARTVEEPYREVALQRLDLLAQ